MDCWTIAAVVVLLYLLFGRKEGMSSYVPMKGAYTASLVDRDAERRYFTAIDDSNANPIVVDCDAHGEGCRYIDAPKNFVRWSSQI